LRQPERGNLNNSITKLFSYILEVFFFVFHKIQGKKKVQAKTNQVKNRKKLLCALFDLIKLLVDCKLCTH